MDISQNIPLFFILVFSGTMIFSVLVNSIFLRFARTLGIRNNPEMQNRWSSTVKPALGGISFYLIFLFSFILLEILFGKSYSYFSDKKLLGILAVVTIAFLMGLADDAFDTRPVLKFLTQFICAIILLVTGTKIMVFDSEFLNYSLTIIWVIGLMNSLNMLDNMDAITTVISMIILCFCIYLNISVANALSPVNFLSVCLLGTLSGFLIFNWHPSQVFMGDTGSQFLGIFIAILGIDYCWNVETINSFNLPVLYPSKSLLVIGLVFLVPLTDTITVVVNRLLAGRSPFVGGKDHTTHHLFFNGVTEKKIALFFALLNTTSCVLAFYVIQEKDWSWVNLAIYSIYPIIVFLFLFSITKRAK